MEEIIDIANDVPTTPIFKCETCGKVFQKELGLKIHRSSHFDKPKPRRTLPRKKRGAAIKTIPPAYAHDAMKTEEQIQRPNEPWRPASILFASKRPGLRPRWVRKDLLEKRVEEGWQPRLSDSRNRVESPEKTIVDGVPLGNYVTKRNMVLCDMPEELAKSREDYFRRQNDGSLKAQQQQFAGETGGHSYGEIEVGK